MEPYEVLIYRIDEDGDAYAWGPDIIFAKDKETAERIFLSDRHDSIKDFIEEVRVCSRPF